MDEHKHYLLDTLLKRLDFYSATVNSKAAFIIAFDSFVLGGLILKSDELLGSFKQPTLSILSIILLFVLLFGLGWSLFWVFYAIVPYLETGNKTQEYHSLIFSKSINDLSLKTFKKKIDELNYTDLQKDLINQCHILAVGLSGKYNCISKSTIGILIFVLFPLFIIVMLKLIDWLLTTY